MIWDKTIIYSRYRWVGNMENWNLQKTLEFFWYWHFQPFTYISPCHVNLPSETVTFFWPHTPFRKKILAPRPPSPNTHKKRIQSLRLKLIIKKNSNIFLLYAKGTFYVPYLTQSYRPTAQGAGLRLRPSPVSALHSSHEQWIKKIPPSRRWFFMSYNEPKERKKRNVASC